MKKMISVLACGFIAVGGAFSFASCKKDPDDEDMIKDFSSYSYILSSKASDYFNTASTILYYYDTKEEGEKQRAESVLSDTDAYIKEVEFSLGSESVGGDVYRFNEAKAGERISIGKMTYDALKETEKIYFETDGAYNPAVSMLVDLWGFSPRILNAGSSYQPTQKYDRAVIADELPKEEYREAFQTLTNFGDILLEEDEEGYYVTKPSNTVTVEGITYSMKIDLGGYGKGYAADGAAEIIRQAGFSFGYVSLGGSSLRILQYPCYETENGVPYDWSIKFTYPTQFGSFLGDWYARVYDQNVGVSTSGNYEHFYVNDGVLYCHIIDASTGCPIQTGICSASIVGGDAAENDALTTALSVMGVEKAISFVNENLTDRKVTFVYTNDELQQFEVYTNVEENGFSIQEGYDTLFKIFGIGDGEGKIKVL